MSKTTTILMFSAVLMFLVSPALADDVYPAYYRGYSRTVHAVWDDWTSLPTGPDYINPEAPSGTEAYDGGGTHEMLPTYEGRTHVVKLNDDFDLCFAIQNFEDPNPYKWVRLQLTYWDDPAIVEDIRMNGQGDGDPDSLTSVTKGDTSDRGDGWLTTYWDLVYEPNPKTEWIWLYEWNYEDLYIDQAVIDTWCVPEPATMCLLALGGIGVLLRRRRK